MSQTYVLDTSVLLSDPRAILRFAEHAVVIPVIVIAELEKKRHDPEIGYFARKALRNLDDLRVGVNLFLAADSPIGPVFFAVAASDEGRSALYFFIGKPF